MRILSHALVSEEPFVGVIAAGWWGSRRHSASTGSGKARRGEASDQEDVTITVIAPKTFATPKRSGIQISRCVSAQYVGFPLLTAQRPPLPVAPGRSWQPTAFFGSVVGT